MEELEKIQQLIEKLPEQDRYIISGMLNLILAAFYAGEIKSLYLHNNIFLDELTKKLALYRPPCQN